MDFERLNPGFSPNFEPTPQMNDEVQIVDAHTREPAAQPPLNQPEQSPWN